MITYQLDIHCQKTRYYASDMEFVTGDVGAYCLEFTFLDNNKKMDISHYTLAVKCRRADGVVLSDAGEIKDNVGRIVLKNGFYTVPGTVELEIALTDSAKNYVTTKIISATVIEGAGEPDDVAEGNVSVYVTLIAQLQSQLEAARTVTKTLEEDIKNKVDKVPGKELSSNDYSNEEKEKVSCVFEKTKIITEEILPGKADASSVYTKEETDAKVPKWKTLLDVWLTEEQAGVGSIKVAIEDIESLTKAKEIRFAMCFPGIQDKAANSYWSSVVLQDYYATKYNETILAGYNKANIAGDTIHMAASVNILDFKYSHVACKSFHSVFQLPNKHFMASSNTSCTASQITGRYACDFMQESGYEPYLYINLGGAKMILGTHIFLEVLVA